MYKDIVKTLRKDIVGEYIVSTVHIKFKSEYSSFEVDQYETIVFRKEDFEGGRANELYSYTVLKSEINAILHHEEVMEMVEKLGDDFLTPEESLSILKNIK